MALVLSDEMLEYYMVRCITLAKKTRISPPHVGALIVSQSGNVIGTGYRRIIRPIRTPLHAERIALQEAGPDARGGWLFSTLEPCYIPDRVGKTLLKSCCELIVESEINTVVYALADNSPSVNSGRGVFALKNHGVEVIHYEKLNDRILREVRVGKYVSLAH